jgi:hypothetical protein
MFWSKFVPATLSLRLVRIWPLSLSLVALETFLYSSPLFYETLATRSVARKQLDGIPSSALNTTRKIARIFFMLISQAALHMGAEGCTTAKTRTFIVEYCRKVGDPSGVTFLREKPWNSTIEPVAWNFEFTRIAMAILAVVFILGILLSVGRRCAAVHRPNGHRRAIAGRGLG